MATNSNIIFNRLTANGSTTGAASYALASVAPVSGQVLFLAVMSVKATTPDTPTVSGTNGMNATWTQVGSTLTLQTPAGNFIGLSIFTATASSGSAGIVTVSYGGNTQLGAIWDLLQSPFINTSTPTVQSKTATDTTSGTTMSVTLNSALSAQQNWVVGVFGQNANAAPGVTSLSQNEYSPLPGSSNSNENVGNGIGLKVVVGSTTTMTMQSLTASIAKVAFLVEIAQDGTGVVTGGLMGNPGFAGGFTQ